MVDELIVDFDDAMVKLEELSKRHKEAREEKTKLQGLVIAMEADHKKAARLVAQYEKMEKDRERLKAKVTELLEKLEKLRI